MPLTLRNFCQTLLTLQRHRVHVSLSLAVAIFEIPVLASLGLTLCCVAAFP